jgi:hypothetical protein
MQHIDAQPMATPRLYSLSSPQAANISTMALLSHSGKPQSLRGAHSALRHAHIDLPIPTSQSPASASPACSKPATSHRIGQLWESQLIMYNSSVKWDFSANSLKLDGHQPFTVTSSTCSEDFDLLHLVHDGLKSAAMLVESTPTCP